MNIKIDFSNKPGAIKPMHAVNNGPRSGGAHLARDVSEQFKKMKTPYCRLHDTEGAYGMRQFADISCIFPDFNADAKDEKSYNFTMTDRYVKAIYDCGAKVFYRLGESIEHFSYKLTTNPPKDYRKWAEICEHIILHYNYGWANGFYYGIEYWEIWNEPDNPKMWTGTHQEFFELYRIAANYLKQKFPALKIGGYSASGFYCLNRENPWEWFKTLVPYMHEFFAYITDEKTKAPMDFFSWHCYAKDPEEVGLHARFAQDLLKEYGLNGIESVLTEYNTFGSLSSSPYYDEKYLATLLSTLCVGQKSPVDMIMYYDARLISMNGLFELEHFKEIKVLPGFYAMEYFGRLYGLGTCVYSTDIEGALYTLAATDGKTYAMVAACYDYSGKADISLTGKQFKFAKIERRDKNGQSTVTEKVKITDDTLSFDSESLSVYYIEFFN